MKIMAKKRSEIILPEIFTCIDVNSNINVNNANINVKSAVWSKIPLKAIPCFLIRNPVNAIMFPSLRTMIFHVNWWKSKYKFWQKTDAILWMSMSFIIHLHIEKKLEYSQIFPTIETISTNEWNLPQEYRHLFKNKEHWICHAPSSSNKTNIFTSEFKWGSLKTIPFIM